METRLTVITTWRSITILRLLNTTLVIMMMTTMMVASVNCFDIFTENDWGTVFPTGDGVQANSWSLGVKSGVLRTRLAESASPSTLLAPRNNASVPSLNLTFQGFSLGRAEGVISLAYTNQLPYIASDGNLTISVPGVAFGEVAIDNYTLQVGGNNALVIRLDDITSALMSVPQSPVLFGTSISSGSISFMGVKLMDITQGTPINTKVRIPLDPAQPLIAMVYLNEQITTFLNGTATTVNGSYVLDPSATSGYINLVRVKLNSPPLDITMGHAAVIRDPAKTDQFRNTTETLSNSL